MTFFLQHYLSKVKPLLCILLIGGSGMALAQEQRVHQLHYTGEFDPFMRKHVIQVVRDLDQEGMASFDQHQLKVRIDESISGEELLNNLNSLDLGIFEFNNVVGSSFPVKIHTGDPAADEAAYNAAKQAWIEEHPEEYQQMLRSTDPSSSEGMNDE